jgi:hypothetical protein
MGVLELVARVEAQLVGQTGTGPLDTWRPSTWRPAAAKVVASAA